MCNFFCRRSCCIIYKIPF
ncbi:(2Fe-2S)-binding protein [Clostridioides sp. GD02404]